MKKEIQIPIYAIVFLCAGAYASAATTFNFHDGSSTIGSGSAFNDADGPVTDTVDGITLTAEAFLDGNSTDTNLNGATGSFGINADGTADVTQRFDNDEGIETMDFSFNTAGTFDSIDLKFIEEPADEAELVFGGGGTTTQLNTSTPGSTNNASAYSFTIGESFTAGQDITLGITSSAAVGENFSLESFTVTPVPEPGHYAALLGLFSLGFIYWQRRRAH